MIVGHLQEFETIVFRREPVGISVHPPDTLRRAAQRPARKKAKRQAERRDRQCQGGVPGLATLTISPP